MRHEEKAKLLCDDYGKDFEKKYTKKGLNQGAHRRVVSSKLGQFTLLTRFEVDCVESGDVLSTRAASMSSVKLNMGKPIPFAKSSSKLAYFKHGEFKQEKLVELTTKTSYEGEKKFPASKWNQMLLSNTEYLVLGWHGRGNLLAIEALFRASCQSLQPRQR
jgi:hypothetical protein